MASNPYLSYYALQSGTGISSYQGVRWQKGHSFFGRLLRRAAYPILKFLGREALSTGADIAKDVLAGQKFKESAKGRLKEHGRTVAEKAISKIEEMTQKQAGSRRRRGKAKTSRKTLAKKRAVVSQSGRGINIRRARKTILVPKSTPRKTSTKRRKTAKTSRKSRKSSALASFVW